MARYAKPSVRGSQDCIYIKREREIVREKERKRARETAIERQRESE